MRAEWKRRIVAITVGFTVARGIMRPIEWAIAKYLMAAPPPLSIGDVVRGTARLCDHGSVPKSLTGVVALSALVLTFWCADRIPDEAWDRLGFRVPVGAVVGVLIAAIMAGLVAALFYYGASAPLGWDEVMQ